MDGTGPCYVVTGGGRGIGRAVVERLLDIGPQAAAGGPAAGPGKAAGASTVVAVESDASALSWADDHPAGSRLVTVVGDGADERVAERAAEHAAGAGRLVGWVNNAAVFPPAEPFHTAGSASVRESVTRNLDLAVVGCATAVRSFLDAGTAGAIVNMSSHQARQAVAGCAPYVTAKAAIEGLTRALAVEYGPCGIRVNAVAPGSIGTERYERFLAGLEPEAAAEIERQMGLLHPIGRVGRPAEVAAVVAHLLSAEASYVSGATVPVDGGRTVLARDPEAL